MKYMNKILLVAFVSCGVGLVSASENKKFESQENLEEQESIEIFEDALNRTTRELEEALKKGNLSNQERNQFIFDHLSEYVGSELAYEFMSVAEETQKEEKK